MYSLLICRPYYSFSLYHTTHTPLSPLLLSLLRQRERENAIETNKEERDVAMINTIRGYISCVLPCGALDVVRIVHCNGHIEEISGSVKASEIMKAYPKHVLKKPSSPSDDGIVPKIVIVPPDAELKRGKIYFLMPIPAAPKKTCSRSSVKKKTKRENDSNTNNTMSVTNLLISDRYLSEILSEKLSTQRDRRRGRAGVWRPHLESIYESPTDV